MQTKESLKKLISEVSYSDWEYHLCFKNEIPYLQITFVAPDNMTGEMALQSCRKWMLSYHMCDDEVLTTALKATLGAVEHETREQFKWKGQPIYRPHYDPKELYELVSEMPFKKEMK